MSQTTSPGPDTDRRALLRDALRAVDDMQGKLDAAEQARREPIAIVGLGCRLPGGVTSPEAYWRLLRDGVDAVTELPADRWGPDAYRRFDAEGTGAIPTCYGGFLDGLDRFDARFFGISPREAASMDPQQRIVLEVVWEALERAGIAADRLAGSATGVFIGVTTADYLDLVKAADPGAFDVYTATGNAHNAVAGRVSYALGLQGPSMAIDTACSSSLVAIHLACQSLRSGESRLALAGGVNAILTPDAFVCFTRWGMMAPDGRCKAFDARADGFVRAEGCGVVVLKRLSDARADGDRVLAVIRGSAVNQDGASSGLTVPNGLAQQLVIRQALDRAGVSPAEIGYVEAHGTGTAIGDPIELEAIDAVLGEGRDRDRPLVVGSVKTNLGHLESASGVTGLIKVVLSLQHGEIPPHLHFETLNPKISLRRLSVRVPTEPLPWPAAAGPRIAGVSSFGFSGTNAHVVLAEAPAATAPAPAGAERPAHVLILSARSEPALRELAGRYEALLAEGPAPALGDVCATAATGRAHLPQRVAVSADSAAAMRRDLAAFAHTGAAGAAATARVAAGARPRVAFLFSGQGAQFAGMGRELHGSQPVFRQALDRCADILGPHLERPLLGVLFAPEGSDDARLLGETAYTQPALFAVEWALAELLRSFGVVPAAVLGHSVGEYAAACVAGVLELEPALRLVAERGRLMQSLPAGGEMAAVFAGEERVAAAVTRHAGALSIAAVNGPDSVVVSGAGPAVRAVVAELAADGIGARSLAVSHAFHSPLLDPVLDAVEAAAARVSARAPRIPLASNLSGRFFEAGEVPDARYWRRHAREAVRFSAGVSALAERGIATFVEVGPGTALLGLARRALPDTAGPWLPTLRAGRGEWAQLLGTLGELWVRGADVAWAEVEAGFARRRVALPTYPFQRERHWASPPAAGKGRRPDRTPAGVEGAVHPLLGRRLRTAGRETIFDSRVTGEAPGWLKDHVVHGAVVMPGTAYLEMGLALAAAAGGAAPHVVEAVAFERVLALGADEERPVQVVLAGAAGGQQPAFEISSLPDPDGDWQLHARGRIGDPAGPPSPGLDLAGLRASCPQPVDVPSYYGALQRSGVEYGSSFRGLEELWRGAGQALGAVRLPAEVDAAGYQVHPALLDACLQACGAALPGMADGEWASSVYLPVGVRRVELYGHGERALWVHAAVAGEAASGADALEMDLTLLRDNGEMVGRVLGLGLRKVTREALNRSRQARTRDWTYQPVWLPAPRVSRTSASPAEGTWAVLVDRGGSGEAIARGLEARGQRCTRVRPGAAYGDDAGTVTLDPGHPAGFERLLVDLAGEPPLRGVVHAWGLDGPAPEAVTTASLQETQTRDCGSLLALVQAIAGRPGGRPLQLCVVTRGAVPVGRGSSDVAVASAPLVGLADVVGLEHPALACLVVDLDPAALEPEADEVVAELLDRDREDQVAFRGGLRHVRRLVRWSPARSAGATADGPVTLAIGNRGVLDQLALCPAPRPDPGPGEVSIRVRAAGLNFRDVLNALGMYPGDAGPLGNECAGTVEAVGAGVDGIQRGQAVIALAGNCFGTFTTAAADLVVPKPERLSFEAAASVPIAFLTAVYGLQHCARLAKGERVLIHAAAGGVGLAAVQVAQKAGAEVFATAGSARKRAFLADLGVAHVMDSRSLDFAGEIRTLTGGRGVDVVLNSLSGDFIARSVDVLAAGGRFVEIGKRDIWDAARMAAVRPDVEYHVFDLGVVLGDDRAFIVAMLRDLVADFQEGRLSPSPWIVFALEDAAAAFRHLAQARHIGKVVLAPSAASSLGHEPVVEADATYLVTGGLGALGLQVARSLVEAGARHLVLVGRRPPEGEAREALRGLEAAGAQVDVAQSDVARVEDMRQLLDEIKRSRPPLRGIVHAAGVLDDGVLTQQSWDRFQRVLAPKVEGAWNLHALTAEWPLRFFVLFSSASALLGSPGQGSYTAANAFLDALAHHRRAHGLPALSINWGAWGDVGMAAAQTARQQERAARWGVQTMAPTDALAVMHELLRGAPPQIGVLSMDWTRMLSQFPAGAEPPRLAVLAEPVGTQPQGPAADARPLPERLRTAPGRDPGEVVAEFVGERVGAVLGLPSTQLDTATPLVNLGLDSLMAVELKNRIERDGAPALPLARYLDGSDIAGLAGTLLAALDGAAAVAAGGGDGLDPTELLARLHEMSEAEMDTLLARMTNGGDDR